MSHLISTESLFPLPRYTLTTIVIKEVVKQSPSSFNSQSSRAVILLGKDHDDYWSTTVPDALRAVVKDDESYKQGAKRIEGFRPAYGTVLFFEEQKTTEEFQKNIPAYAHMFPQWGTHGNAMAQINTWVALELEGYVSVY